MAQFSMFTVSHPVPIASANLQLCLHESNVPIFAIVRFSIETRSVTPWSRPGCFGEALIPTAKLANLLEACVRAHSLLSLSGLPYMWSGLAKDHFCSEIS